MALALMPMCGMAADAPLRFATVFPENTPMYRYAAGYLEQLCKEVEKRCEMSLLPARRSEAMMNSGALHGEMGRTLAYAARHSRYIALPSPFLVIKTRAFSAPDRPVINSWEQLESGASSVAYLRGVLLYELKLKAMQPKVVAHDVQDLPACLRLVLAGRDSACLYDDLVTNDYTQKLLALGRSGAVLESVDLHVVLGPASAALSADIIKAAQRMQTRGLTRQLQQQYLFSAGTP